MRIEKSYSQIEVSADPVSLLWLQLNHEEKSLTQREVVPNGTAGSSRLQVARDGCSAITLLQ